MALANPYNYKKPKGHMALKTQSIDKGNVEKSNNAPKNEYLEQMILAAKPHELTLMLYEGAIKFMKKAKLYNDQKDIEKTNNSIVRAEAIITELRSTLNMDYEISNEFERLYDFINHCLIQANIEKDGKYLDDALVITENIKDTWKEAVGKL